MNRENLFARALEDTICAVSTPPGAGGIGVIRISGPETYAVLERVFHDRHGRRVRVTGLPSHVVRYGFIRDGRVVRDEVLLTVMRAPRSYTRQDMAEIGCHGGYAALRAVMETLLEHGCRLAGPGEFTRRAFLSGRIDLVQAEAVLALVNSRTEREQAAALEQLRGGAARRMLSSLEENLAGLLADINAAIDFPGETGGLAEAGLRERLEGVIGEVRAFSGSLEQGRVLAEGIRTAVIGRPNVGKSCLLNALLARERAIVSAVSGTTRDEISETLSVGGYPLTVIDTAGIRPPRNSIEAEGVRRSRAWLKRAELVLLVLDRARRPAPADRALLEAAPPGRTIIVLNKADRPDRFGVLEETGFPRVTVSALTGSGLEELKRMIVDLVTGGGVVAAGGHPVFLDLERREKLAAAAGALAAARRSLAEGLPLEFPAADLARAAGALAAVTGRDAGAGMLERIFSRFCVGK